jgi:GNAT superfamily N-acetyltransferase
MEWAWVYDKAHRLWDYTEKSTHPRNFVITEQGVLISHTEVNWRMLDHAGESYKVYGLSAVFTYPAFRREGFGRQVVEAATGFIDKSDADFAMLFCARDMESFMGMRVGRPYWGCELLTGLKTRPSWMMATL